MHVDCMTEYEGRMAERDYKSGFRRLWLVLSAAWIVFIIGFAFQSNMYFVDALLSIVLPVAGLYALLAGVLWVRNGFSRQY